MIRLGQGVFVKGRLDRNAIHRAIHAFSTFRRISDEFSVSRIIALGTSALREAMDGPKLVDQIKKITGIDVRTISGSEEARLIALGILSNAKLPKVRTALIDIGGGSTEISMVHNKKILYCESLPLGTARLQQVFLKKSPPSAESIEKLRQFIRKGLPVHLSASTSLKVSEVMGSSGTIKALTKIAKKQTGRKVLGTHELRLLVKKMSQMTTTQLLGLSGMEAKRVDMILAGAILLEECVTAFGAERIIPTDYSLRDGIVREQVELVDKHIKSNMALHLPDLMEKAKKLGGDEKNIKAVCKNAEILFQKFRPLHKLDQNWSLYLEAAVVLRNVGKAVSIVGHPEHSYYIVKNSHFPFVEDWESELVAQLCRCHNHAKVDFKTLPFKRETMQGRVFLKLLGILCIVDALDAVPSSLVVIKKVSLAKNSVGITFSRGSYSDLEVFRVESRKTLFQQIYRKKIVLRRA